MTEPTIDPMKQAWSEVAEGFEALGRMMKERYHTAGVGESDEAEGEDASGAALRDAFDRFVAAGRQLGDRAADVARDDDVRAQARQAASSLNDALSATVDMIGEQVGGLFKRSKGDEQAPGKPPSDPPSAGTPE